MTGSTQTNITFLLFVIIAAFFGLCVLLAIDGLPKLMNPGIQKIVFLVCLFVGGIALLAIRNFLLDHFKGLERLRGDVITMASRAHAVIPEDSADQGGAEFKQILQAVRDLADYVKRTADVPDSHLKSVLKSVTQPFVDILLLAVTLIDELPDHNLEGLTKYLGVTIHDRHSALGDSLVEADALSCLIPRLKDKGMVTYGDALAFSQKAKRIVRG